MEIFGAGVAVFGGLFALKKKDQEKLAEMLGAMGVVAIISANPILGLVALAVGAWGYLVQR